MPFLKPFMLQTHTVPGFRLDLTFLYRQACRYVGRKAEKQVGPSVSRGAAALKVSCSY